MKRPLIKWAGWRQPSNQIGVFGVWYAIARPVETATTLTYATTLGVVAEASETGTIDTSWQPGWPTPIAVELMTIRERTALKARAREALLARFRG